MKPMHTKKPKSGSEILSEVEPSQPKGMPEKVDQVVAGAKKHPSSEEVDAGMKKNAPLREQEREDYKEKLRKERGPKRGLSGFAEGGEVSGEMHVEDSSPDEEMHDMLGSELMEALHSKDPKMIMPCLEACVLSIMNKGSMDDEE